MQIDAWLPRAAAARPHELAIDMPHDHVMYGELLREAELAAGALQAAGVGRGDRIGILLPPGIEFARTLHACFLLGAVAQPLDSRHTEEERAVRAEGTALVVSEPLVSEHAGQDLDAAHDLDAPAVLMHTSGSTGRPKPVALTYGNFYWSALGSALALGLDPQTERWLCALPLAHVGGLSILIRSAIYGTTAVVHERFDPAAILAADHITRISLVPTMLARLLDAGWDPGASLRTALIGGGPLPPVVRERALAAALPVAQTYGMTEACSQVTTSEPGEAQTAGVPLSPTRVQIAGDGEILVAGPTVAPAAPGPDGWLHTGDLGVLDEHGRLIVTGRKSDVIVTGGENVSPVEVEAVLLEHACVADAAVHARPDEEWGERLVASIVLRSGMWATPDELRTHVLGHLARFKVPKDIDFVDELPRTATGKLIRDRLR